MTRVLIACFTLIAPYTAHALEIFACEPEWGSLATEIAGDLGKVTSATTAYQDPHSLQARPSLIAAARNADLLVCAGADLEIGWLPLLLRRASNPAIQVGSPGHFLAADYVRRLEIPKSIDRSHGDVHPQGNPHMHLSPRNIERVAQALADRLAAPPPGRAGGPRRRAGQLLDPPAQPRVGAPLAVPRHAPQRAQALLAQRGPVPPGRRSARLPGGGPAPDRAGDPGRGAGAVHRVGLGPLQGLLPARKQQGYVDRVLVDIQTNIGDIVIVHDRLLSYAALSPPRAATS